MVSLSFPIALFLALSSPGSAAGTETADLQYEPAQAGDSLAVHSPAETLEERVADLEAVLTSEQRAREDLERTIEEIIAEDRAVEDRVDPNPDLAGYLDFEFQNDDRPSSYSAFRQHHISLIPSHEHGDFRAFAEIEFEYGTEFSGTGGEQVEEARGKLVVEQAWVEYLHSDSFTLRGGRLLTPGYWNVNHYSNTVLPTRKPLMVGAVFPGIVTGLMAYGGSNASSFEGSYAGYIANGESGNSGKEDDDENKAVGGRVVLHVFTTDQFDHVDLGISGYGEHFNQNGETRIVGFDAEIAQGPLAILSEFARRAGAKGRRGLYAQPSYRIGQMVTPFYRYDMLRTGAGDLREEHTVGINFRPVTPVAIKAEYYRSVRSDVPDYNGVAFSAALAF